MSSLPSSCVSLQTSFLSAGQPRLLHSRGRGFWTVNTPNAQTVDANSRPRWKFAFRHHSGSLHSFSRRCAEWERGQGNLQSISTVNSSIRQLIESPRSEDSKHCRRAVVIWTCKNKQAYMTHTLKCLCTALTVIFLYMRFQVYLGFSTSFIWATEARWTVNGHFLANQWFQINGRHQGDRRTRWVHTPQGLEFDASRGYW